jgi:hypothetical protein
MIVSHNYPYLDITCWVGAQKFQGSACVDTGFDAGCGFVFIGEKDWKSNSRDSRVSLWLVQNTIGGDYHFASKNF